VNRGIFLNFPLPQDVPQALAARAIIGAMATKDKRVDAYIAKSAEFAKPILRPLRESVYQGCHEVEETMKWSFPHFAYKGLLL
jgi:hypothetical protein